jgi:hypothetical protein
MNVPTKTLRIAAALLLGITTGFSRNTAGSTNHDCRVKRGMACTWKEIDGHVHGAS